MPWAVRWRNLRLGVPRDLLSTVAKEGDTVNLADFDVVIANLEGPGVAGQLLKEQVARLIATGGSLFAIDWDKHVLSPGAADRHQAGAH